jgi:hypothetical protein
MAAKPSESEKPTLPLAITYSTVDAATAPRTWATMETTILPAGKRPPAHKADGHGRAEVAAGDVPYRAGHGDDHEAEGQRHADESDARGPERCSQNRCPSATEDEPESAEELRRRLLAGTHA